jgi:hypothetical protein
MITGTKVDASYSVDFGDQTAQNLTYVCLYFQKFSRGLLKKEEEGSGLEAEDRRDED